MFRTISGALCLALLVGACQKDGQDQTAFSEQPTKEPKPVVAIVPVIDNSNHSADWNLSDELTYSICFRLEQKDHLQIEDVQKIRSITRKFQASHNPFGEDLKWVKRAFPQDDFVVFMELLEHEQALNQLTKTSTPQDCSVNLNISLRVRVVDVRDAEPHIALQEIIHDSHFIPRQFTQYNFHQVAWGNEDFNISPVGIAHAQFIKEVSARIEEYILLAKSG